jgi:DNA repair exonuclease SbcCD ATPase subunit
MNLKKITLTDYRNFEGTVSFPFYKITHITGENGTGKTTLGLLAFLFAIYGWSEDSLEDLITKGKKSTKVEIEIDDLIISREYPTTPSSLKIYKNNKELIFSNNVERQNYLNEIFKNIDYFRKFRMIDTQKGISILESGKTAIRKTLVSFNESYFNNIRNGLQEKKREREMYNKDRIISYTLYPSQKRLDFINMKLLSLSEELVNIEKEINETEKEYLELLTKKGKKESIIEYYKSQKDRINQYSKCPTCLRGITPTLKIELLKEVNDKISEANETISILLENINERKDILNYFKSIKNNIDKHQKKLFNYQLKLSNRIEQKDFKYTDKDVLILKKAIEELDNFLSYYLAEWTKILEPLINSLIEKIGFKIEFIINTKGDFDLKIYKNGIEYSYKNLSTGQRLILSIAFQLAFLLEKGETGLIIADEGFGNLDENNLNLIIEFFKSIPFQLIYIVHRFDTPEGVRAISL